jgi:hypothetical protein
VVENEGIGHGKTPEKYFQESSKLQQMTGLPSARRRTRANIVGLLPSPALRAGGLPPARPARPQRQKNRQALKQG